MYIQSVVVVGLQPPLGSVRTLPPLIFSLKVAPVPFLVLGAQSYRQNLKDTH